MRAQYECYNAVRRTRRVLVRPCTFRVSFFRARAARRIIVCGTRVRIKTLLVQLLRMYPKNVQTAGPFHVGYFEYIRPVG